jgi:hypothetical protein
MHAIGVLIPSGRTSASFVEQDSSATPLRVGEVRRDVEGLRVRQAIPTVTLRHSRSGEDSEGAVKKRFSVEEITAELQQAAQGVPSAISVARSGLALERNATEETIAEHTRLNSAETCRAPG